MWPSMTDSDVRRATAMQATYPAGGFAWGVRLTLARHFAFMAARTLAWRFQFGMFRLVFGFAQVFFVRTQLGLSNAEVTASASTYHHVGTRTAQALLRLDTSVARGNAL
jgi:hypothetical protein